MSCCPPLVCRGVSISLLSPYSSWVWLGRADVLGLWESMNGISYQRQTDPTVQSSLHSTLYSTERREYKENPDNKYLLSRSTSTQTRSEQIHVQDPDENETTPIHPSPSPVQLLLLPNTFTSLVYFRRRQCSPTIAQRPTVQGSSTGHWHRRRTPSRNQTTHGSP